MKTFCALFFFLVVTTHSFSQNITVSNNGKTVVCIFDSKTTDGDLKASVGELYKYGITMTIQSKTYNDDGGLRKLAFKVVTPSGTASYSTDNVAELPGGIKLISDESGLSKVALSVGPAEMSKESSR